GAQDGPAPRRTRPGGQARPLPGRAARHQDAGGLRRVLQERHDALHLPAIRELSAMKRLALIGLGGMGTGMGLRLLDKGFSLRVYTRAPGRAEPLIAAGALAASGVADAVADTDVVILSLSDEAAVEEVLFERMGSALRPGTLLVDTSTVSPHYAREAARR